MASESRWYGKGGVTVIWYPQIFRTRGYQSTEDLIPGGGGLSNPCSSGGKERRCFAEVYYYDGRIWA